MKSPEVRPERFESVLRESSVHQKRLTQAKQKCAAVFPLVPTTYSELTDDQVEHIDQLVYRFTKLQDALPLCQALPADGCRLARGLGFSDDLRCACRV